MRHGLLISVAAAALAATSLASAQTATKGPTPAAPAMNAAPSTQGATETSPSDQAPGAHQKRVQDHGGPQKHMTQQPVKGPGTAQSETDHKNQPIQRNTQSDINKHPDGTAQAPSHAQDTKQHNQATGDRPMTSRSVSLTTEQKTTIRQKVLTSSAPRVQGRVNFDIKVGVAVPRTIRVAPLPTTIVEIEPQWRGYMYFVNGDEIIVVEPGSLRIVAVLDV